MILGFKKYMKNIAVIGHGYVGKAMENFFKDHYKLFVYDPPFMEQTFMEQTSKKERFEEDGIVFTSSRDEINSCDLAVVCTPTPKGEQGEVDLGIIYETFEWLNTPLILIKSTIPPGTTDKLIAGEGGGQAGKKIAFSPEYIGEGKYVVQWWKDKAYPHPTEMKFHDFFIFGGEKEVTTEIISFFQKVVGPEVKYMQTDTKTAELTKYMENSWGATKVTFCNEFYNIAKTFGVDYNELRELWLLDGRVERMHTVVFPDKRGFGGKCFPKDVHGIAKASEEAGYEPKLLKSVLDINEDLQKLNP